MNQRQKQILQILLENDEALPASRISQALNVSNKTIYNDISILNQELDELGIALRKVPRKGIEMIADEPSRNALRQQILAPQKEQADRYDPSSRRKELFRILFIEGKPISLQQTADQYMISRTSILNDLRSFDLFMRDTALKFTTGMDRLIRVEGSEKNIQRAVFRYLKESLMQLESLAKNYFSKTAIEAAFTVINDATIMPARSLPEYYERSFHLTLLILFERAANQHHILGQEKDLTKLSAYPLACQTAQHASHFGIELREPDLIYLSGYFIAYRILPPFPDEQTDEMVQKIIQRFTQLEQIDFSQDEQLKEQLRSHLPAMIWRLKNNVRIENPLLAKIKQNYLPLFTASWYVLAILETEHQILLTDSEVSFVMLYFQLAMDKMFPSRKILVACPYGLASSKFMVQKLRQFLPVRDVIETCSSWQLGQKLKEGADLLITTYAAELKSDIPTICVSPMLTSKECTAILHLYADAVLGQEDSLSRILSSNGVELGPLLDALHEENIYLNCSFQNKEEVLDFILSENLQKGIIEEGYRESVYKREKVGSTVLENNTAIPHGNPGYARKLEVSLLTLTSAVDWSGYPVRLILFLSIPEKDILLFDGIVFDICQLIANEKVVARILDSSNPHSLIENLKAKTSN